MSAEEAARAGLIYLPGVGHCDDHGNVIVPESVGGTQHPGDPTRTSSQQFPQMPSHGGPGSPHSPSNRGGAAEDTNEEAETLYGAMMDHQPRRGGSKQHYRLSNPPLNPTLASHMAPGGNPMLVSRDTAANVASKRLSKGNQQNSPLGRGSFMSRHINPVPPFPNAEVSLAELAGELDANWDAIPGI